MALTFNSGPVVVTGNTDSSANRVPEQGPSLDFQGTGVLDPRFVGSIGASLGHLVYGFYANPYFALVDGVPSVVNTGRVAAPQFLTAGTAMALVSVQGTGVSPNLPLVPFLQPYAAANTVTVPLTLDFGFTPANTVLGSKTVTIPAGAWKFFQNGQAIAISGAAGNNAPLVTSVVGTPAPNALTITVNAAAGATLTATQIGNVDASSSSVWPYVTAGQIALADPSQSLCRGLSVTCATAAGAGGTITIRGYDIFGQAMSETITVGAGAVTAYGKKAFKYIVSATAGFTSGTPYSIGTSDMFGFTVRADLWEYLQVFVAGAFLSINTGYTAADATAPATSTTGDVRGTLQIGLLGPLAQGAAGGPTDGIKRVAGFMSMPLYNAVGANNLAYSTMYGSTQA